MELVCWCIACYEPSVFLIGAQFNGHTEVWITISVDVVRFFRSRSFMSVCVLYSSIIHPYWISHFEVLLIRRTMQTMHSSRTINTPSERERACVCVMPLFELRTKNIVWPFFCSIGRYIHWLNKYRPHCDRWRYRRKYTTHRTESLHHSLVWIYLYLYTFYLECGYFWTC